MALQPDDILDNKYQILRLLGEGGMGAVYEGLNTRIRRRVAIKILHGSVASNQEAVQRFEREAQAAGRIGSKHIVEVIDLGDLPGGDRYMVMEYLDGTDLTGRIRALGKMSPKELYPIAVQILEGLIAAHEAGIIHRDLKPDNIFLVPEGDYADFVKLLDFGISKFSATGGELSMTQTGMVMGTPYYMSPEQAKGSRELDQRTDLYSVGVILYEALAGRVPYHAETFNELIIKIVLEEPRPLDPPRSEMEALFHGIVTKAMARDPKARFQSAAELQGELHDWARTFDVPLSAIVKRRSNFPPGQTRMHGTQRAWVQTTTASNITENPPLIPKKRAFGIAATALTALFALAGTLVFMMWPQPDEALLPTAIQEPPPPISAPPNSDASSRHSSPAIPTGPEPRSTLDEPAQELVSPKNIEEHSLAPETPTPAAAPLPSGQLSAPKTSPKRERSTSTKSPPAATSPSSTTEPRSATPPSSGDPPTTAPSTTTSKGRTIRTTL